MEKYDLLGDNKKQQEKNYAKFRKVLPLHPLNVLEMDIKLVWIEKDRRNAFVLSILDTFSRKWMYVYTSFSITQTEVKESLKYIINNYLQPSDCLREGLHIEIRNDNDPRFSAYSIKAFFEENKIGQVYTHPYTPQENAHIESFHSILNKHLSKTNFWTLEQLEQDLCLFQEKYNNQRQHSSILYLCPNDFEVLWEKNLIHACVDLQKRKIKFKLLLPRHEVRQHTGNDELEGSSLPTITAPRWGENRSNEEMSGANISEQLTV
jgi:putative transposase